jgi:hypothetical protein
MPRHDHGHPLNQLVMQPGRSLVLKEDGSVTGQVKFRCDLGLVTQLWPKKGLPHPEHPHCWLFNSTAAMIENGIAEFTCDYLGILRDPTDYQVEFLGTVCEEPIETHPQFVGEIGGTMGDPKNKAKFDPETGEFLGFPPDAPEHLGGVRGYLNPACTVRVSWFTQSASSGLWELGEISSPPGNVPRPPGSRNWLKTNWSRRDYNSVFQITEEYTASGRQGWNKLLYD